MRGDIAQDSPEALLGLAEIDQYRLAWLDLLPLRRALRQLDQDPARIFRVEERDPASSRAGPGRLAHCPDPRPLQRTQGRFDVLHGKAEVMKSFPSLAQKPSHSAIFLDRLQQLEAGLAPAQETDADPLGGESLDRAERHADPSGVNTSAACNAAYGDPDVVDLQEHLVILRRLRSPSRCSRRAAKTNLVQHLLDGRVGIDPPIGDLPDDPVELPIGQAGIPRAIQQPVPEQVEEARG